SKNFRAFCCAGADELCHAIAVLSRDERPHIRLRFTIGRSDPDALRAMRYSWQSSSRHASHYHGGGAGHATFARTSEGAFDYAARRVVYLCIWHDDDEIFCATVCLHAVAVMRAVVKNVARDRS